MIIPPTSQECVISRNDIESEWAFIIMQQCMATLLESCHNGFMAKTVTTGNFHNHIGHIAHQKTNVFGWPCEVERTN